MSADRIRPDRPDTIRRMFEGLAPDYDRLNDLLTFGLVRTWRRALVREARLRPGDRVVDVATGTGRGLPGLRRAVGPAGLVVGVDFTEGMIRRAAGHRVLGDALLMPFPDGVFDAAVSAFALRDVAHQGQMIQEMVRVTRPGGRVAILEIGRPARQPLRLGFDLWFRGAVPGLAALAGRAESHRFLVRSLRYLPRPADLARVLAASGVREVTWRDLSLGAARLFGGTRSSPRRALKGYPRALPRLGTGREGIPRREAGLVFEIPPLRRRRALVGSTRPSGREERRVPWHFEILPMACRSGDGGMTVS